jgi:multidrug efflux system membrane fusion protein
MYSYHIIRLLKPLSFIALLAVFAAGCSKGEKPADAGVPPPPEVSVAAVVSKTVHQWDEFTGRIAAIDTVELRPRVSGYIDRIAFKEGDEVKAGDLLFVIDPRPYRIALDSARAQLERAHSSAQFAQLQERRAQPLIEEQAISRGEYDQRTTNLTQGNADVRAAEAAVANARLNLDFTQVRSPITGRVGRALLTVGNLAQADESMLTTVVSQDPVYVYFQPDEQTYLRYAELARKGERPGSANPVRVGLATDTGYPYHGTVNFVSNQVDPATGTINARAVVPNPDRMFTPGLYARVQLQGSGEFPAILIDDKAVMTDQDRKYVYVLGPENNAMRKDITLGGMIDGLRVIKSGLEPTDKVVVAGLQKIFFPGAPVKPNEVPMVAPPAAASTHGVSMATR